MLALGKSHPYFAQERVNGKTMASAALQQIIDDFALFDGWEDRYGYLIDLAKNLPPFPNELKTANHLVKGCMSQVWLVPERSEDGRFHFRADSDAVLVRGLIGVLYAAYDGQTPDEVRGLDIQNVFHKLGLEQNLSPNRRNGFFAMVEALRRLA